MNEQNTTIVKPNAEARDVDELFAGKIFRVPNYQRNYAWNEKNWEDFWNDIREGLETGTEHYWGTITLKATNETYSCEEEDKYFKVYEVVDGQQRLTTIYLFLLALSNNGKYILKRRFIKCGDIYRLELGGLNHQFLKDLVDEKDPTPTIETNKLLKGCLEYFENQIKSFGRLDELSRYLQKVTFSLEFVVQDQTLAVKAFESLNDRGKPLTLLDKTKSYLMFISLRYLKNNNLNETINKVFGNVFINYDVIKEIGEQENIDYIKSARFTEDELLRFFYHYFAWYAIRQYELQDIGYDYDATASDVFEIFLKESCSYLKNSQKLEEFIMEFLNELDKFVLSFRKIMENVKIDCKIRKLFCFLGLNTRVYPLIISLEAENLLDDYMLNLLETLDIRVYKIKGTDPRADLYRDVISEIKVNPDYQKIVNGGKDDRGNNLWGIRDFINHFMNDSLFHYYLNGDMYDSPAVKYILWEYEKYVHPDSFDDCDYELYKKCQIEHIFPEEPTVNFPTHNFDDINEYFSNIHKLGNLCLLEESINKKIKNKTPQKKSKYYQKSQIPRTRQLGYNIHNKGLNKDDIRQLTRSIIVFCLKRWKI